MHFDFNRIPSGTQPEPFSPKKERTKEENDQFFTELGVKIPWLNLSEELMQDRSLSADEQKLLALISFKTNKDYQFYGSAGYIAYILNLSISSVRRIINRLINNGYLYCKKISYKRRLLSTKINYCDNHTLEIGEGKGTTEDFKNFLDEQFWIADE